VRYTLRNSYIAQSQQTAISFVVFMTIAREDATNNIVKQSKSASQWENQALNFQLLSVLSSLNSLVLISISMSAVLLVCYDKPLRYFAFAAREVNI
jgi:hypothetical protein